MRELLLCPADYYGIEYEINPWMSRARGAEAALARRQWEQLHATLSKLDCKVHLISPQPGLPDMVFTANAGLTVGRKFIPALSATKNVLVNSRCLRNGWKNVTTTCSG